MVGEMILKIRLVLAVKIAQNAIEADPSEPDAHRSLGAARLFLRKHDLAISSFRKALELNPNGASLIADLGWALSYSGQPEEGLQFAKEAIARNPYYPDGTFGVLRGPVLSLIAMKKRLKRLKNVRQGQTSPIFCSP